MGIGNRNQYSYNPDTGYYTDFYGRPVFRLPESYIQQQQTPSSNISNLVQQAMAAQANPVSMAQLFPYMNYGGTNNTGMGGLLDMIGQGSSGAGRFLGASNPLTTNSTTM